MSCAAMLDQILEADLELLTGAGDSDVARHVRECARCGAIALQIVGDTRLLGVAAADVRATTKGAPITASPTLARRQSRRRMTIGAALAAALCVVVAAEWARRKASTHEVSHVAAVVARNSNVPDLTMSPATVVALRPTERPRVRPIQRRAAAAVRGTQPRFVRATPTVVATVAERTMVKPFDPPNAVAPVRIDSITNVALGGTVAVDPPTGVRANIIRTPNPSVTVVWLYQ
jgi:hypothetical protein